MSTESPLIPPLIRSDVEAASVRLAGLVRRTPIWSIDPREFDLGQHSPASITFKLEQFQHSGTFKARGATNFMLTQPIGEAGVVAASGGNHGAAVAWAAGQHGHQATIFVPTISAKAKVDRLRSYGATVHQTGAVFAEAYAASEEFRLDSGATPIHAYNDPVVMAGAGTTGLEFQEQVAAAGSPKLDTVLVACGGGGLSGGIAAAIGSDTRIVVCETEGTATFAQALKAGKPADITVTGLGADALGASCLGSNTWAVLTNSKALSRLITDEQLASAQSLLWNQFRIRVEPSAAAPLAVLLSGSYQPRSDEHIGIILCGGNVAAG